LQWELSEPTLAEVLVWNQDNPAELRRELVPPETTQLELTDLSPATTYRAVLLVGGARPRLLDEIWPTLSFSTTSQEFTGLRVGVLGDSGFGEETTLQLAQRLAGAEPDLVLHTGDLVYRVGEEADPSAAFAAKLFATLQPLLATAPFYPVPGNHEFDLAARHDGAPYYQRAFAPFESGTVEFPVESEGLWYSFVVEDVQFLMLNSQSLFGIPGRSQQEAWLAERVNRGGYRTTVVVLHVPPYNAGRHRTDSRVVESAWGDLLGSAQVGLVLSGHDHNYQRHSVAGKTYIVSGGGSSSLYTVQASVAGVQAALRASHVVVLEIRETEIEITALDKEGRSLDHAVIPIP
jgi:predicted phosphodiesterase